MNCEYTEMKAKDSPCSCHCHIRIEDVSVHGLPQLVHSKHRSARFFWLAVLIASFLCLIYEVYQIVDYYRSVPKATRVTWVVQEQYDYPDLAFCTKRWMSLQKVRKLNISDNAVMFLLSLIEFDFEVDANYSETAAKKEVEATMLHFGIKNYVDVLKAIAFDGNVILQHRAGPQPLGIEPFIPYMSMCYRLMLPKIDAKWLRHKIRLGFDYVPPSPNVGYIYNWDEDNPSLLIRESSGVKVDPITFSKNITYRVYVEAQVYKRLSSRNKPCMKDHEIPDNYYIGMCERICVERKTFEAGCRPCVTLSILSELNWTLAAHPCSYAIGKTVVQQQPMCNSSESDTINIECSIGHLKCLPVCDELTYKYSTTILSEKKQDKVEFWLTLNPFDGVLTFEEVPTYTFDTFVSNVGGQLGLWLGASVVSVIQTVLCFFSFVFGKNKTVSRRPTEEDINRRISMNEKAKKLSIYHNERDFDRSSFATDANIFPKIYVADNEELKQTYNNFNPE